MSQAVLRHTEGSNSFEDLSGVSAQASSNPYDALIHASNDDPTQVQSRYSIHRTTRNAQQRTKLLDPGFAGVTLDPILQKLVDPSIDPSHVDPRHCLVFWARPPAQIRSLVNDVQQRLRSVATNLWLMPLECLHMTTLEITHSRTAQEIAQLIEAIKSRVPDITDYTLHHRARLTKPMLSYDGSALALSFLPAAGESVSTGRTPADDAYTYHHLRRDVYELCRQAGVTVDSRYTVPSAHLTIGRFVVADDHSKKDTGNCVPDHEKMQRWIETIEQINTSLEQHYWPEAGTEGIEAGGEWIVGQEKGLDCRYGSLWYGGGTTFRLGRGF